MTGLQIHTDDSDALISDGRIVHLRDLGADDRTELIGLHERASDRSIYLRYFSGNRPAADQYIARIALTFAKSRPAPAITASTSTP